MRIQLPISVFESAARAMHEAVSPVAQRQRIEHEDAMRTQRENAQVARLAALTLQSVMYGELEADEERRLGLKRMVAECSYDLQHGDINTVGIDHPEVLGLLPASTEIDLHI